MTISIPVPQTTINVMMMMIVFLISAHDTDRLSSGDMLMY